MPVTIPIDNEKQGLALRGPLSNPKQLHRPDWLPYLRLQGNHAACPVFRNSQ
jgi:hypothetical protein